MVHESLGLVTPLAGSQIQLPPIDPPINLDIAPTFADDGVIAGDESEVLRAIQHMKSGGCCRDHSTRDAFRRFKMRYALQRWMAILKF